MTTMTNEQMATAVEVLSTLGETGKLGYAIARNLRKLKDSATEYFEMRSKFFHEFGTKKNGMYSVPIDVYTENMGDIGRIEHEVDIYQIDEETFFSGGLTSSQMEQLMWMVKE